jgi:hypothetical protein
MDPAPDPTPDPTPFFSNFKETKNWFFPFFFSYNFFAKIMYYILFCKHYFCPLNTFKRKRKGSGSIPLTNGFESRRPKNMRIRIRGSIPLDYGCGPSYFFWFSRTWYIYGRPNNIRILRMRIRNTGNKEVTKQ